MVSWCIARMSRKRKIFFFFFGRMCLVLPMPKKCYVIRSQFWSIKLLVAQLYVINLIYYTLISSIKYAKKVYEFPLSRPKIVWRSKSAAL